MCTYDARTARHVRAYAYAHTSDYAPLTCRSRPPWHVRPICPHVRATRPAWHVRAVPDMRRLWARYTPRYTLRDTPINPNVSNAFRCICFTSLVMCYAGAINKTEQRRQQSGGPTGQPLNRLHWKVWFDTESLITTEWIETPVERLMARQAAGCLRRNNTRAQARCKHAAPPVEKGVRAIP